MEIFLKQDKKMLVKKSPTKGVQLQTFLSGFLFKTGKYQKECYMALDNIQNNIRGILISNRKVIRLFSNPSNFLNTRLVSIP